MPDKKITPQEAYDLGYIDGMYAFAWHGKKGLEVGTCGKLFATAKEERKEIFNYHPPLTEV